MKIKTWTTVILSLSLMLLKMNAFAQQYISGKLVDSNGSKPISGASVTIIALKDSSKLQTPTDILGKFTSVALPNGDYLISVQPMGYTADIRKIKLAGKTVEVNFKL